MPPSPPHLPPPLTLRLPNERVTTNVISGQSSETYVVLSSQLPVPTTPPPFPTKKSHARKRPAGHIPRPRNAFILFRCDFVRQQKIPRSFEKDQNNISRIAGNIWGQMTDEQKSPWVKMAEKERREHIVKYPDYRFNPFGSSTGSQTVRKTGSPRPKVELSGNQLEGAYTSTPWFDDGIPPPARRRSLSCPPPGSVPVMSVVNSSPGRSGVPPMPYTTQDDLSQGRRPSAAIMYHLAQSEHNCLSMFFAPPLNESLPVLTHGPYAVAPSAWDPALRPYEWNETHFMSDPANDLVSCSCSKQ